MKFGTSRLLSAFMGCALAAFVAAGAAGADNTTTFPDTVGDAGRNLDITGLQVTEEWGYLNFWVTFTDNYLCNGEGGDVGATIAIDTDQNPDTGSAFYGTEYELAFQGSNFARSGEGLFLRANGWDFKSVEPPGGFGWGCGPTGAGYSVDASSLGLGPKDGFNVVAAAISPHTDTAPDIRTFNYQPVAGTPPPNPGPDTRAPHVSAFPAKANHGKVARLTYWVQDGRGVTGETIRIYRRNRLLKTLRRPLADSNPFDLTHLSWRVPSNIRGRLRFSVRAVDGAGNDSQVAWAQLVIR